MKKSLIALAALGSFAGFAAAQSSVTVYGQVDQALSKMNTGTSNLAYFQNFHIGNRNVWTLHSMASSRLGFRGTEDLGNGMRANFLIEHRFSPDTGAVENRDGGAGNFWNAQTYVGLSGGFGEVRLGRQFTPHFYVALATDPFLYEYNVAGTAGFTRGGNGVTTAYNAVNYFTPNLGGFTASVQVAAGEGGSAAVGAPAGRVGRNQGINLQYAAGPLWVGLGYNDAKQEGVAAKNQSTVLGATYDFGVVKAFANYSRGKNNSTNVAKTMLLGAHVRVGNGFVRTAVGRYDAAVGVDPNAAATSPWNGNPVLLGQKNTKFAIGYVHNVSKRTSLSADIGTAKTSSSGATSFSRSTGYQFGVKHLF